MESTGTNRMSSRPHRRPPLHTCGVALLMIAHSAYKGSQNFNGPLGSITRKVARFDKIVSPFICVLQYQWLATLSFSDDCILAIEKTIETIFPQSSHVFNEIDKLIQFTETLPGKFDDAVTKFHMVNDQVPLLDWVLVHVLSWLNFCTTQLTHWRGSEEKEIMIDSNSNECDKESPPPPPSSSSSSPSPSSNCVGLESKGKFPPSSEPSPPTYKEALEKGSRKEINKEKNGDGRVNCCTKSSAREDEKENKNHDTMEENMKKDVLDEETEKGEKIGTDHPDCEYVTRSDPILELFESGWLTKSSKEGKGNLLSLSSSFTG
ncbi:hypothetical protein ACOSP7_018626 [Xanthoceras sorbifolium]